MAFDVKRLDIYRKVPKDLTQPTYTGAFISICCCVFMALLFLSEFWNFITVDVVSELFVDNPGDSDEKIPVKLNISLPNMKCEYVGLDIQDEMGRHEVGFIDNTIKTPISDGKGCMFVTNFQINKVPGNFHVSTHAANDQPDNADFAHMIHELNLGARIPNPAIPGSFNPLRNRMKIDGGDAVSYDYVMKIVPTVYEDLSGNSLVSYQYTYAVREYVPFGFGGRMAPAIWFKYDLTPITVKYHEKRSPFYSFITKVCAIVGGTFTVAGIIDSCIFTASEVFRKFEIGKLS